MRALELEVSEGVEEALTCGVANVMNPEAARRWAEQKVGEGQGPRLQVERSVEGHGTPSMGAVNRADRDRCGRVLSPEKRVPVEADQVVGPCLLRAFIVFQCLA